MPSKKPYSQKSHSRRAADIEQFQEKWEPVFRPELRGINPALREGSAVDAIC
jgi:hypothetical protein